MASSPHIIVDMTSLGPTAQPQNTAKFIPGDTESSPSLWFASQRQDFRQWRLNAELLEAILDEWGIEKIKGILKEGASANATCWDTLTTALHLAVHCGEEELVKLLLDEGADVGRRDKKGTGAVDIAKAMGSRVLQQMLSDQKPTSGADGHSTVIKDSNSFNSWCHKDTAVTSKILISNMSETNIIENIATDVRAVDENNPQKNQRNGLDDVTDQLAHKKFAARSGPQLHRKILQKDIAAIYGVLKTSNDTEVLNIRDKRGCTPLHLAVAQEWLPGVTLLLEAGADTNIYSSDQRTVLHLAVTQQWLEGVRVLLVAGADVTKVSRDRKTVLHLAAVYPDSRIFELLLSVPGSSKALDERDNNQMTPIMCAVVEGQSRCVERLLDREADISRFIGLMPENKTLLHLAAENGQAKVLEILLKEPRIAAEKDLTESYGKTALHYAAIHGFDSCVEVLLKNNCNCFAKLTGPTKSGNSEDDFYFEYGFTPLHLAVSSGHVKVVELILKHDIKTINENLDNKCSPLLAAAVCLKTECVRLLLLNGANLCDIGAIDPESNKAWTALNSIFWTIPDPIDFLRETFDRCIVNNDNRQFSDFNVTVKYNILSPLSSTTNQFEVLECLLNCESGHLDELLLHPVIRTFIYQKWRKVRTLCFVLMTLHIVFTASLTTTAMCVYTAEPDSTFANWCTFGSRLTSSISILLITSVEIVKATRMQRYYYKDFESWIKWSTILLSLLVIVGLNRADRLVEVSAVAVLLSWVELLFQISRWRTPLELYGLMFFTVVKKVMEVMATFLCVILGYVFAFMIFFQAKGQFSDWFTSFVKVMAMTMDFDYDSVFEDVDEVQALVGRGIYLSFLVLVSISLMNLLIGLAVEDIKDLKEKGRSQFLAKQVEFLSTIDTLITIENVTCFLPKRLLDKFKTWRSKPNDLTIAPGCEVPLSHPIMAEICRIAAKNNLMKKEGQSKESLEDSKLSGNQ